MRQSLIVHDIEWHNWWQLFRIRKWPFLKVKHSLVQGSTTLFEWLSIYQYGNLESKPLKKEKIELKILHYHMVQFHTLEIHPIFVFDGRNRPKSSNWDLARQYSAVFDEFQLISLHVCLNINYEAEETSVWWNTTQLLQTMFFTKLYSELRLQMYKEFDINKNTRHVPRDCYYERMESGRKINSAYLESDYQSKLYLPHSEILR